MHSPAGSYGNGQRLVRYGSPEEFEDIRPLLLQVSVKADIYSFGVLLWEIITLERPLQRGNLREPM